MDFKLGKYVEIEKERYERKYVEYNGNSVHISKFADKSIGTTELSNMRMNSYAQDDLPPKLTNTALIVEAEKYLKHCSKPIFPCVTYEESLIHKILPELLKRLKEYE